MHILVVVLVVAIVLYLLLRQNNNADSAVTDSALPAPASADNHSFGFIARGKLFVRDTKGELQQIHSPFVQDAMDRLQRRRNLHGWKANTSWGQSFTGQSRDLVADQIDLNMVSVLFLDQHNMLYFLRDDSVGGLFRYNTESHSEQRLIHRQNLHLEGLNVSPDHSRLLCSQHDNSGVADIVSMGIEGDDMQQLTEGDTMDIAPAWVPNRPGQIVYQSSGLARSEEGYLVAIGPAAVKLLDIQDNEVTTVLESPDTDYMQPRVDSQGNLYYIRRPYEGVGYSTSNMLLDSILFPFRLIRAVIHYLNFFSLMYSKKPLTSASGPEVQTDLKDLLIKGRRIDTERALRKERRVAGVPSLVPGTWQLVKRTHTGQETVLATNVASYDITSDDVILYSNGFAVFSLQPGYQPGLVLKEKFIGEVIARNIGE